ncbi:hypothetical protein HNR46_000684 [Haloferula luteola]|uniref:Glycine zipper domain-containing protein n=1 Tax=Haloferula luteola TaxID=595692 RepID=A0A840V924_9BACT|nr:hypothetical protein [Haloferula luteola]MBB5350460.1 hypothetical protein [Haloferula luteola]
MTSKIAILGVALSLASCTTYQQSGAVMGAVAGGLAGAAFGDDHQDVIAGAAVGAGLGAGAAAISENQRRQRDYDRYGIPAPENGSGEAYAPQQSPPSQSAPAPTPSSYPTANPSGTPGQVVSPYPPYKKIDVTGFSSGQLAKDPTSGKIFRVP